MDFEENNTIYVNELLTILKTLSYLKRLETLAKKNEFKFYQTSSVEKYLLCKKNVKSTNIVIKDEQDLKIVRWFYIHVYGIKQEKDVTSINFYVSGFLCFMFIRNLNTLCK